MKKIEWIISCAIGTFFSFFGILAIPLALLILCNLIDYFTGMTASKIMGIQITSDMSFQGIVKKITMYVLVFVGFGIDNMVNYTTTTLHIDMVFPLLFSSIIASWLVINELISITENCEKIGVKIPLLAPILSIIKRKIELTIDIEEDDNDKEY